MTMRSIEEALGDLKIRSVTINLRNDIASIDLIYRHGAWEATYWGADIRVGSGETPEEAIANVVQAIKARKEAEAR